MPAPDWWNPGDLPGMFERNMPLARRIARRYAPALARGGPDEDDLLQVCLLALWRAVGRYDPGKGFSFSTFAWLVIDRDAVNLVRESQHKGLRGVARCPAAETGGEATGKLDRRPDGRAADPAEAAEHADELARLPGLLAGLDGRELLAVVATVGHGALLRDVADVVGVSKERSRQLRAAGLAKARTAAGAVA